MAETTPRSRRARSATSQARRSARPRSAAARRRPRSSQARSRSASSASRSATRGRAGTSRPASRNAASRNGNHGAIESASDAIGSVATKVRGPLIAGSAAAAGAIGGIVLGARVLRPRKRVLGIPIPRKGIGLKPLAHEVRRAGRPLEHVADGVGKAKAQAQKVGKALS